MTIEQILLLLGALILSFSFWSVQRRKEKQALKGRVIIFGDPVNGRKLLSKINNG